ncbi:Aquaporin-9 [Entomophthora muscae]|uniref:Aquaporin-9 n=1 Tax=Entomophthora muscae TaxID=34485 RepID=A0ACC2RL12_9FUNG|nr:Aquaporin-9 [Entomophthora muscae]
MDSDFSKEDQRKTLVPDITAINILDLDQCESKPLPSLAKPFLFGVREYLAEFVGTLLLVLFGDGAVAQTTINPAAAGSGYLSINLGFAFGLTCAIFVAGPISGAHLNPAVTLAQVLVRKFPLKKVIGYMLAQVLGAFAASALVYLIYWPAFSALDGGVRQVTGSEATAGIFATYPNPNAPNFNSFITESIITAVFILCILAITDPRSKTPFHVGALAIGLTIGVVGLSLGVMTGYALNPARDFGPRLFTAVAGWGVETFTASDYYFWVPILGPFLGGALAALLYSPFVYAE